MTKSEELVDLIVQCRAGGRVKRLHTIPLNCEYTVGDHQWGCVMLLWYIFPQHFGKIAPVLLAHDVPEAWLGDIPAPTMRYVPNLKEDIGQLEERLLDDLYLRSEKILNKKEYSIYKAIDRLELYLRCREEMAMGNQMVAEVINELERFFEAEPLPGDAMLVYQTLRKTSVIPRRTGMVQSLTTSKDKENG